MSLDFLVLSILFSPRLCVLSQQSVSLPSHTVAVNHVERDNEDAECKVENNAVNDQFTCNFADLSVGLIVCQQHHVVHNH